MFDVQTGSLWPQILGEAINGTYHGTRLQIVTTTRLPLGDWMALHPEAKVVARPWGPVLCPSPCPVPLGFEGYDVNPYANYQAGNSTYAPIRSPDSRLHPKTFVVGVVLGGDAWAVAYPDLLERRAVNAVVGGVPIVATLAVDPGQGIFPTSSAHVYNRETLTLQVDNESNELVDDAGDRYAIRTGVGPKGSLEPVSFFYGFWFAWHDYHPHTRLFGFEPTTAPRVLELGIAQVGAIVAGGVALSTVTLWRRRRRRN